MKIIFAGSNSFAAYILNELQKKYYIELVITQTDKKTGRGQKVAFNPVKDIAVKNSIEIFQPLNINTEESLDYLSGLNPDLLVVVAYGQILSNKLINIFNKLCINLHLSLLPDLRGASPVETALLKGYDKTGISIQKINEKLDAGDIFAQQEVEVEENDTSLQLYEKMKEPSIKLLLSVLNDIEKDSFTLTKQNDDLSTYAKKIFKDNTIIDWNSKVSDIHNLVRALSEITGVKTKFKDKSVKIIETKKINNNFQELKNLEIGEALFYNKKLIIKCSDGLIEILKLQPENKKIMQAIDFINGRHLHKGDVIKFD